MSIKCNKCGADIPDNAAFCPGCGAPKPAEQPTPKPAPEPVAEPQPVATSPLASAPKPVKQPRPTGAGLQGLADMIFSKTLVMLGFCIGVLLAWIGVLLAFFLGGGGAMLGLILLMTGLTLDGFVMFGGGFLNKNIDKNIRLGMIVGGAIIISLVYSGLFTAVTTFARY